MDDVLKKALEGKAPCTIVIEDTPRAGQIEVLGIVVRTVPMRTNIEGHGVVEHIGFALTREQAVRFAVRLTKILGPLDTDS